ncbi:hypothetical protein [Sphaerisporangium dianthi]|uniref:Tn3 transposase DDE domain-containing protein n=1 Tax=Sphaerisporangium dianthi TaxID=1436120 RepID=A0ABV9CIY2_9ACTN
MEDRLGALGLAMNAVIWWNSLYIDPAVTRLRERGPVLPGGRQALPKLEHRRPPEDA